MTTVPITYKYEVYDATGRYLGVLPNVTSIFNYSEDINTAGSQLQISVAQDIDTSNQGVLLITDESGNQITDESGNPLTTDRAPDLYGNVNSDALIRNGNTIVVWEYSSWHVNGIKVFTGRITRWNAHIGTGDDIDLTVLAGSDLDNNILFGGYSIDQQITNLKSNQNVIIQGGIYDSAQVFTTGLGVTSMAGVIIEPSLVNTTGVTYGTTFTLTATIYQYSGGNPNSGTLLGSGTITITTASFSSGQQTTILFSSSVAVNPLSKYAVVFSTSASHLSLAGTSQSSYTDGNEWGGFGGSWTSFSSNLVFISIVNNNLGNFTNSIYYSKDPVTGIAEDFMNNYISLGGTMTLGTMTAANVIATASFILNTLSEGLNTCLALCPSGFYYYVDVAINQLNFTQKSSTPDVVFIFKVHVNTFELLATTENTKNVIYLTAGNDQNGNTIMANAVNPASLNQFGAGLDRQSNSNIIDTTTAQLVATNSAQTESIEQYQSQISIFATNYDISTLKIGMIVGFTGFNSYADTVQMQIVGIIRYSDYITLNLGTIPKRASKKAENLQRQLLALQTINNPLTPT